MSRPETLPAGPDLAQWLELQRQAGALDSQGQFTLDPQQAWEKLASSLLKLQPEAYLIKVIQAAVRATMEQFWAAEPFQHYQMARPALALEAFSDRIHLKGHFLLTQPTALARALETGAPPADPLLKHLWLAVLAACAQPQIVGIEFTASDGQRQERLEIATERLGAPGLRETVERASNPGSAWWSWDVLTRKKPRGLRRLWDWAARDHEGLDPDLEGMSVRTFAGAPLDWGGERGWTTDPSLLSRPSLGIRGHLAAQLGRPWQTLAESYELAEPGDTEAFSARWGEVRRAFRRTPVKMPRWYQFQEQQGCVLPESNSPPPWKMVYCDLSAGVSKSSTMAFAGEHFLCRRAILLPLRPSPDEEKEDLWTGDGRVYVIQDGACVCSWSEHLYYPGARVFLTLPELATDLSTFEAVRTPALERCLREVRDEIYQLVERAQAALPELREQHPAEYESLRSLFQERVREASGPSQRQWRMLAPNLFPEAITPNA